MIIHPLIWSALIINAFQLVSYTVAFVTWSSKRLDKIDLVHPMSSNNEASPSTNEFRIGYASDIEGHWDYFLDYVSRSNVLYWEPIPNNVTSDEYRFHRLMLRPETHFVYGGDSVDKGPGDIRFTRALVDLKKRFPTRVHLLVGNRDLNKLRFQTELGEYEMSLPVEEIQKPFWDVNALCYREFLESIRDGRPLDEINTKVNKLKWMLEHTLGCPDTFEHRRQEIETWKLIHGRYPPNYDDDRVYDTVIDQFDIKERIVVTDEQVVQSFEHEINHPLGSLRQYLRHASIAAIIGNTIFVHGAIDTLTMKYVPSLKSKFELPTNIPSSVVALSSNLSDNLVINDDTIMVENVHEWVESLNNFLQDGLDDFEARPNWNSSRTSRGGEALLAIQNRPSMWGRSVVCNSYGDGGVIATANSEVEQMIALQTSIADANPLMFEGTASNVFDPKPAKWLLSHGIMRIVVGHKPTGDCPSVLSSEYTGVEVISADTSYSHRKELDNLACTFGLCRGEAISLVEIVGSEHSNWLETSGSLACGRQYFNRFPLLTKHNNKTGYHHSAESFDKNLGKKLPGGWWVKALISPEHYHLCRGSGRFVEYELRSVKDVNTQLRSVVV
jgi:hypothetical protein